MVIGFITTYQSVPITTDVEYEWAGRSCHWGDNIRV